MLLLFIFNCSLVFSSQWEKLIHILNHENQIISEEFYLSDIKNPSSDEELMHTINSLKSSFGLTVACNFPARYTFLKNKNHNLPVYDLSTCDDLNEFIDGFGKDKLSLVFSSEYTNNPSSSFGHTMLVFQNINENIEIGDAVHFAAETSSADSFIDYTFKGFNGGYNGYFLREPFYKKKFEYNTLEQRYIYVYDLDYSKEDILFILYHLYELRKASFKYYFLNGNCATRTTDLLNIVNNKSRKADTYYLPIETLKEFKNNIIKKYKFIPLINKLELLVRKMSENEKKLFISIIENKKDVKDTYPDIVKEAMANYTTLYFRKFRKVYKNYDSVVDKSYYKQNINDQSSDPLLKTQPSNIGLGISKQKNNNFLYLHYRPLFIDMADIQDNKLQQSQVSILTFDVLLNDKVSKLSKLDLINIKSYPSQTIFYKPISWAVLSGLNRFNNNNSLKLDNKLSMGKSVLLNNNLYMNSMLSIGFESSVFYSAPELSFTYNLGNSNKIGFSTEFKYYFKDEYYINKAFYSYRYKNFIYQFNYDHDSSIDPNKFTLHVKYNF